MSGIVVSGDTSGSVTLQAPAVAGAAVVTLPDYSSTLRSTDINSVRQTVLYGPTTAAGQPDLIPQSQVGNTLAAGVTLKGTTAPFHVTSGAGFNTDGSQKNYNKVISTDVNSGALAPSATNYIWINTQSGVVFSNSLVDIFQPGGTISITNGQFTYDYVNHKLFYGNGVSAVDAAYVCVAEVDTNATVVTAIRVRAYAGFYDSGFTNTLVGAAGTYSKNHNMGTKEFTAIETIECITTDAGFAVGDQLDEVWGFNATYFHKAALTKLRNTVIMRRTVAAPGYGGAHATTGVATNFVAANWKYKMVVRRNF